MLNNHEDANRDMNFTLKKSIPLTISTNTNKGCTPRSTTRYPQFGYQRACREWKKLLQTYRNMEWGICFEKKINSVKIIFPLHAKFLALD